MKYFKNKRNDKLTQKPNILKSNKEKCILINLYKKDKTVTTRAVEIRKML